MLNVFDAFRRRTHDQLAQSDLEQAKVMLLNEQARAEYHNHMVKYYDQMVNRLTIYVEAGKTTAKGAK